MSKASLKSPTKAALKKTGLTAGGALAGFFVAQLVANTIAQVNDPYAQGAQAVGAATLHASISGTDNVAKLGKGASLGYALFNLSQLGQKLGNHVVTLRGGEAVGPNGVDPYDLVARATLPPDQYPSIGFTPDVELPAGDTPIVETTETDLSLNSAMTPFGPAALNSPKRTGAAVLM
jgi:hypothetical protein